MKRQGLGLHSVHVLWLNTSCAPYITVAASPAVIFCTDLQLKAKDKNRFFSVGSVSLERFVCSLHFPSFSMCCWKRHNLQIMLTIFPLTNVSTQPVRVTGVGLLANISCVSSFPHYCFSDQPSCWHIQQIKPNVRKKRDWIIEKIAEKKLAVNNFKWHIIDALRENYSFVFTVLTPLSLRVVSVQPVKMTSSESVL